MPRMEDMIDSLDSAIYISTLNQTKGYWQVPVAKSSVPKTAFFTQLGKYEFLVMPFGLVGAQSCFQCMMNILLALYGEYSAAYMDDLVIFSVTWTNHLFHLHIF